MITEKEFRQAAAVVKYLRAKRQGTPQEAYDLQENINTCLIYRIQQLELKITALEDKLDGRPGNQAAQAGSEMDFGGTASAEHEPPGTSGSI